MMKNLKTNLLVAGSTLLMGGVTLAAEGTTETTLSGLSNIYSEATLKHKLTNTAGEAEVRMDALYKLGSTFFEDKLDISVEAGVKKHTRESHVSQKSTNIEAVFTAYENDLVKLQPYAYLETPYVNSKGESKSTEGRVGAKAPVDYELYTSAGTVGFGAEYDLSGTFGSRPKTVSVLDEDGKFLLVGNEPEGLKLTEVNEDGQYVTTSEAMGLRQVASAKVSFSPNAVSGLYLELKTAHKAVGTPEMKWDEKKGRAVQQTAALGLNKYNHVGGTAHRVRVKYDLSNDLYVQNDLVVVNQVVDGKRNYENVLSLGATLF